jgi:hypothetical protein
MLPDPSSRLLFLHIPKTAGVSIRHLLLRQYPGPTTFIRGSPEHREFFRKSREERETYRVVGGHFRFGLHLLFDTPSRYLTFLRDPVERVISHFAYVQREAHHPLHARVAASSLTLEQWVRLGFDGGGEDNLQIRNLTTRSGPEVPFKGTTRQMLDEAKRVLSERIDFLGITERYEDSVRLLGEQLGWPHPVPVERHNVSPKRPAAADLAPSTRDAILEHNALDAELYAFAVDLFARRMSAAQPRAPGLLARLAGLAPSVRRDAERA